MYQFLQKLLKLLRPSPATANLVQRVPFQVLGFLRNLQNRMRPKGPPPLNFFRQCAKFFLKIFNVSKEFLFQFFSYFATECMLINPKESPFSIFGTLRHFSKEKSTKSFFQKNIFVPSRGKSHFPVISSMKGRLWVSRNCFQSFS